MNVCTRLRRGVSISVWLLHVLTNVEPTPTDQKVFPLKGSDILQGWPPCKHMQPPTMTRPLDALLLSPHKSISSKQATTMHFLLVPFHKKMPDARELKSLAIADWETVMGSYFTCQVFQTWADSHRLMATICSSWTSNQNSYILISCGAPVHLGRIWISPGIWMGSWLWHACLWTLPSLCFPLCLWFALGSLNPSSLPSLCRFICVSLFQSFSLCYVSLDVTLQCKHPHKPINTFSPMYNCSRPYHSAAASTFSKEPTLTSNIIAALHM